MKIQAFAETLQGQQMSQNRDAHLIDLELGLFVVTDGLRRHAAAAEVALKAAQIVQSVLHLHKQTLQRFADNPSYFHRSRATYAVELAIGAANSAIYEAGQADPEHAGMATAIAVLLIAGHNAIYSHVGETRIYHVRGGKIEVLNKDVPHTPPGKGANEEHPGSGVEAPGEAALGLGTQPTIDVRATDIEIAPGDRFLLCTDGLTEYVPNLGEIAKFCSAQLGPDIPRTLLQTAADRSAHDNATALLVSADSENPAKELEDEKKSQALRRLPLFQHLTSLEVFRVLQFMTIKDYKPGDKIISEREQSDELYISLSGQFKVIKNGKILAELDKGSFFGEMGLINKVPRSADVVAKVAARMLVMRRADFKRLISYEPHLAVKLLWSLTIVLNERLRNTSEDLTMLMQMADEADDFFDDDDDEKLDLSKKLGK